MDKNLNYNTDSVKHYVRYNGWVEAFRAIKNHADREHKQRRKPERCKYLTFCAAQAVDVFMLERLSYIHRDPETRRLSNVYFCENDEESFSIISKLIGSEQQGFFGDFVSIVLQDINNDEDIQDNKDPFDEPETSAQRETLRLKQVKKSLLQVFPFDVINLDFYGNFFPKYEGRYSDSCQAYKQVLTLQKVNENYSCVKFTMFLTVYTPVEIRQINQDSFESLEGTIFSNFAYPKFREAFGDKFGHNDPGSLDIHLRFIIGFVKQIVFKESYQLGWQPFLKDVFCYDRYKPKSGELYKMSTFIVEYKRNDTLQALDFAGSIPEVVKEDYLNQLHNLITNKPVIVPQEAEVPQDVKEDLDSVISFRNTFLKEIGVYDEQRFK